jgi:hypothetical protein
MEMPETPFTYKPEEKLPFPLTSKVYCGESVCIPKFPYVIFIYESLYELKLMEFPNILTSPNGPLEP